MAEYPSPKETEDVIDRNISAFIDPELMAKRTKFFKENFEYYGSAGTGAEASVARMTHKESGKIYAVKGLKQKRSSVSNRPQPHHEVRILAILSEIGIGTGQETTVDLSNDFWFPCTPTDSKQCLVIEYCELGSLRDYVEERAYLAQLGLERLWSTQHEGFYRNIYKQIMAGVAFLHFGYGTDAYDAENRRPKGRNAVIHRDIKPDNVLVCPAPPGTHSELVRIKLADFGGAHHVGFPDSEKVLYFFSDDYIAPEFYKGKLPRHMANEASDVFAAGATIHWCIFGRPPYVRRNGEMFPRFKPLTISDKMHKGGSNFSGDFYARVHDALAPKKDRADALQIYEYLEKGHDEYMQAYTAWYDEVEAPRLRAEQEATRQRQAATAARQRQESEDRRERNEETAVMRQAREEAYVWFIKQAEQHPQRIRCHFPFCRFRELGPREHFHVPCTEPNCPMAQTVGLHHHNPGEDEMAEVEAQVRQTMFQRLQEQREQAQPPPFQHVLHTPQHRRAHQPAVQMVQQGQTQAQAGQAAWAQFAQANRERDESEGSPMDLL